MPQNGYEYIEKESGSDFLIVDVTDYESTRSVDYQNQKESYSGKKKLHTMKNLAITDDKGYVLFVSDSYFGSVHDKTIWDDISFNFRDLNILADQQYIFINTSLSLMDSIIETNWSFVGLGQRLEGDTVSFEFSNTGDQLVNIELLTEAGCTYDTTQIIDVLESPISAFSVENTFGSPTFEVSPENNSIGASSFLWISNADTVSNLFEPDLSFDVIGDFNLSLIASNNLGCSDSSGIIIQVSDLSVDLSLNNLSFTTSNSQVNLNLNLFNLSNIILDSLNISIDYGGIFSTEQLLTTSISPNVSFVQQLPVSISQEQFNNLEYICVEAIPNESEIIETNFENNRFCSIIVMN